MKYKEVYKNQLVRVSFTNTNGYEKVATGHIIDEDQYQILVLTVKNENPMIKKSAIINIFPLNKRGNSNE